MSRNGDTQPRRVIFPPGHQRRFLSEAKRRTGGFGVLAKLCGAHPRTIRDWYREKHRMDEAALSIMSSRLKLVPGPHRLIWAYAHTRKAGRIGGRARSKRYGNPGTAEGRQRGGRTTQAFFRANPEQARKVGFVVRKIVRQPQVSTELAELVGVILGDGHVGRYQVMVAFNSRKERAYARYVQRVIRDVFDLSASLRERERSHLTLVVSGVHLIERLAELGLPSGDKLTNGADVPAWVFKREDLMRACLRGLVDTDGTVFFHRHVTRGYRYRHIGLGFTSYAPALLASVG